MIFIYSKDPSSRVSIIAIMLERLEIEEITGIIVVITCAA
jgi:hypothetical protein